MNSKTPIKDGGPAFPTSVSIVHNDAGGQWTEASTVPGLSKRELFAAMAIGGVIQMSTQVAVVAASTGHAYPPGILEPKKLAEGAVEIADALITELEKGT